MGLRCLPSLAVNTAKPGGREDFCASIVVFADVGGTFERRLVLLNSARRVPATVDSSVDAAGLTM